MDWGAMEVWVVGTVPRSVCGGSHVSTKRRWVQL